MLPVTEIEPTLREVVETLAPLDRTPCSPGERQAAEWLAERFAVAGAPAVLEDEPSWGTFPPTSTGLGLVGLAAALLVLRGRRVAGAVLAKCALAGILDEAQNGPRIVRRLVRRKRTTVNVVATAGDPDGGRTLVVLAHHDAPQSGMIFDQTLLRTLYERFPERIGTAKTPFPQWWLGLAGPALTLAAVLSGKRALARTGATFAAIGSALVADVWRNDTVQGANDNLSGVASLVALAELLAERPAPTGLRVLLVSCGAEETLQDGIRAFIARHREELDRGPTAFVNLDTVGSPHLAMLEAEGPVWMEEYEGPWLRDLVEAAAERTGVELERGFRARASTDSVIPSRAGYATATLVSLTKWRAPANYHQQSDVPANLDYGTVAGAVRIVRDVIDVLASAPGESAGEPGMTLAS